MRVQFAWINWGGPLGMSQGVSILAAEAAAAGHQVEVQHFHESLPGPQSAEAMAELLAARDPDCLLLSFGTNQAAVARSITTRFKALRPDVPTLAGGVHCTLTPEEPLSWGTLDYAFVGEADGHMDRLVTRLGNREDISDEPNIATKRGLMKRSAVAPLPDVSTQHPPFFEGIDYRDLCIRMRGLVDVVAGRGCPYRCAYCHNAGLIDLYRAEFQTTVSKIGFTRTRDPHDLLAECIRYREICGEHLKTFAWGDDMAVMSKPFLRTWAEIYPPEFPDTPFALNATLNFLDDEVVELLAAAGCNLVKFGLESGSPRLRRFIQRPDYKDHIIHEALERLRRHGINSRAYVICGIPTETPEELLSTFELASSLRIDTVRPSLFFPYPGTPLHRYCQENDLIDHEVLASVHNYYTRTVLRGFDAHMHRLLGRILDIFPLLMNARLAPPVAERYSPLAAQALSMSDEEWQEGGRDAVLAEQQVLNRHFVTRSEEFYAVPFPDRPDASFLHRRRLRPLVNIDDTPNLTIGAA